jgi:hypothetical protein
MGRASARGRSLRGEHVGTEKVAADDTAEVLAVFAGAAHARPRRPLRLVGGLVAAAFALVSLTVVATHDRGAQAAGGVSVVGNAPASGAPTVTAPTAVGDQVTEVLGPLAPALGLTPSDVATFGSATSADETGGAPAETAGSTPTTVPGDADVAVVTPVLKVFAFGSKVGMPLLCNVAFSAVIGQLPDPTLAQLATAIVTSCVNAGTQGNDALAALNQQLTALEAINPAVSPLVDALVATFNAAGAPGVPFSQSLTALGDLIAYFSATGDPG